MPADLSVDLDATSDDGIGWRRRARLCLLTWASTWLAGWSRRWTMASEGVGEVVEMADAVVVGT